MGTTDVIVIGGGLVGASAAYRLARGGARVTLVDQAHEGQATAAGAGILSPGNSFGHGAIYPLVEQAVAYYPTMLAHLAEDGEAETGYAEVGALQVATSDEEAARLQPVLDQLQARKAAGLGNIGAVARIDSAAARALFPALADVRAAIHISGAARVDGRLLRDSLRRAAQQRGATIVSGHADLLREGNRVTGVRVEGEAIAAGAVILATGAWTDALAGALGLRLPIYPQRGQIAHLLMPETDTSQWPIVLGFHSHYLLTFPPNRIVAGATREHHAGYDYRLTAGGVHEVLGEALRVAPGLAGATLHEIRIGFRPTSPDQIPVIGRAPGFDNVYVSTGHGPSGLQLGPYSGALAADLALGQAPPIDLGPFAVGRFQG